MRAKQSNNNNHNYHNLIFENGLNTRLHYIPAYTDDRTQPDP